MTTYDLAAVSTMKGERNVGALVDALACPDGPEVRVAAAEALGELGDAQAATPLMSALRD